MSLGSCPNSKVLRVINSVVGGIYCLLTFVPIPTPTWLGNVMVLLVLPKTQESGPPSSRGAPNLGVATSWKRFFFTGDCSNGGVAGREAGDSNSQD